MIDILMKEYLERLLRKKNFIRTLEDAKDGIFDLIVTREVSRFARNTVDTLQETKRLKKDWSRSFFQKKEKIC